MVDTPVTAKFDPGKISLSGLVLKKGQRLTVDSPDTFFHGCWRISAVVGDVVSVTRSPDDGHYWVEDLTGRVTIAEWSSLSEKWFLSGVASGLDEECFTVLSERLTRG